MSDAMKFSSIQKKNVLSYIKLQALETYSEHRIKKHSLKIEANFKSA